MRGLRRVAHAPPWPAEHARRACCAWVGGLPPPAASRSRWSLLPAASPRMMGLRRPIPPGGPRAFVRQRWQAPAATSRQLSSRAKREAVRMRVAASKCHDVHKLAIADRPIMRGAAGPLIRAKHASRACSAGAGGACATLRSPLMSGLPPKKAAYCAKLSRGRQHEPTASESSER